MVKSFLLFQTETFSSEVNRERVIASLAPPYLRKVFRSKWHHVNI